jgi:signal recognition particle GTPase
VYEVNQLLKQFAQAKKMMKQLQVAERQGKKGRRRGPFIPGMPGGL